MSRVEIESVADSETEPEGWFMTEYGGIMILEPKVFGHLFVSDTQNYEDLQLVSRG